MNGVLIDKDYLKRFQMVAARNVERFSRLRDELNVREAEDGFLSPEDEDLRRELESAIAGPSEEELGL